MCKVILTHCILLIFKQMAQTDQFYIFHKNLVEFKNDIIIKNTVRDKIMPRKKGQLPSALSK